MSTRLRIVKKYYAVSDSQLFVIQKKKFYYGWVTVKSVSRGGNKIDSHYDTLELAKENLKYFYPNVDEVMYEDEKGPSVLSIIKQHLARRF